MSAQDEADTFDEKMGKPSLFKTEEEQSLHFGFNSVHNPSHLNEVP